MFRDTNKRTLARVITMVLAMAVVTSSASSAKATSAGALSSGKLDALAFGLLAYEASVIGLVIHDLGDMDVESPRSSKNYVADVVLSIPHWVGCIGGLGAWVGESDGDLLLPAVYFCTTAGILSYHATVETDRKEAPSADAGSSKPAAEPARSLSWGPVLLGKDATLGLGLVGRF